MTAEVSHINIKLVLRFAWFLWHSPVRASSVSLHVYT